MSKVGKWESGKVRKLESQKNRRKIIADFLHNSEKILTFATSCKSATKSYGSASLQRARLCVFTLHLSCKTDGKVANFASHRNASDSRKRHKGRGLISIINQLFLTMIKLNFYKDKRQGNVNFGTDNYELVRALKDALNREWLSRQSSLPVPLAQCAAHTTKGVCAPSA